MWAGRHAPARDASNHCLCRWAGMRRAWRRPCYTSIACFTATCSPAVLPSGVAPSRQKTIVPMVKFEGLSMSGEAWLCICACLALWQ